MLDEIRRERACELFGEGFRMDDLKRWGIAHINLTGRKLGRHVLGTLKMDVNVWMLVNLILLLCFLRTMIIMILLIPYIVVLVQSSIPQLEIIVQWGDTAAVSI